ncbi:MAG: hypothetical protein ACK55I_08305, partial [bacterium]
WPFAADRYDLRITIQGLRTPAFDRFSTAWKPNPPNIGSGQKARILQTEQHFDQYENGGWNSPHAASDTEPQEEQQVTPPAMKEVPKQVETDNFLRKPKIIVSDTPRKAYEASDSAPIIQVTSTVPIKFESYFSTETKRKAAWYEEGRIKDINPESVKALKWLVDTHVNREYNTTNRLPKEIHINFGSLLSSALVRGFHTDMEAVLMVTTAALEEEEMSIIKDKNPFAEDHNAIALIRALRKLFPDTEVNHQISKPDMYLNYVVHGFKWTEEVPLSQLSQSAAEARNTWRDALRKWNFGVMSLVEQFSETELKAVDNEVHQRRCLDLFREMVREKKILAESNHPKKASIWHQLD